MKTKTIVVTVTALAVLFAIAVGVGVGVHNRHQRHNRESGIAAPSLGSSTLAAPIRVYQMPNTTGLARKCCLQEVSTSYCLPGKLRLRCRHLVPSNLAACLERTLLRPQQVLLTAI